MRIMSETKKPLQLLALIVLLPLAAVIIIGGLVYFTGQAKESKTTGAPCPAGQHATHTAIIQGNQVKPLNITAKRCDRLVIINNDDTNRLIAFGVHNNHVAYDGVEERLVSTGKSLQITLNQTGDFLFHDHFDESVKGTFSVE